jgi:hypothetical protein
VKQYVPDPAIEALAARLDTVERRLGQVEQLQADVTALGRGVADLTGQVRRLTDLAARPAAVAGSGGSPAASGTEADAAGQPDWTTVTDPDTAAAWLVALADWSGAVLTPLGAAPASPCWPLHPAVVVELLALVAEHRAAYAAAGPTAVSEWLARWLPGATGRIHRALDRCAQERGHVQDGRAYQLPHLDVIAVATWWAGTHGQHPDAVEAFALTRAD